MPSSSPILSARTAVASAAALAALWAGGRCQATDFTSIYRSVHANGAQTTSVAAGGFVQSVGVGATVGIQNSNVGGMAASGHFEGHAVWPAPNNAASDLVVTIDITEPSIVQCVFTLLSLTQTATSIGPGSASVVVRNVDNAPLLEVHSVPPFEVPKTTSATLTLGSGIYTLTLSASAFAGGSNVFNGVNAHSVIDLDLTIVPICGVPTPTSCFSVHSGSCSDAACCSAVCDVDPSCCMSGWDMSCIEIAGGLCAPPPLASDIIVNPLDGHEIALTDSDAWGAARIVAQTHGMDLVTVDSAQASRWLARKVGSPLDPKRWIGANDLSREGSWRWTDGGPLTFANWLPGEPSGTASFEDAAEMDMDGRWNDAWPQIAHPAIVERSRPACGQGGDCHATHGPGCDDESCCNAVCAIDPACCVSAWDDLCAGEAGERCGTEVFAGPFHHPKTHHRYYVIESTSWHQAEKAAILLGGRLASIGSIEENEWARLNFPFALLQSQSVFIGGDDQLFEGTFVGQEGAPLAFTRWNQGEPNNVGNEDFIEMQWSGFWNDLPGWSTRYALVEANCLGDLNDDGWVDAADLGAMLGAWGTHDAAIDLNVDGVVDAADLAVLLGGWGPCPSSDACEPHATPGSDLPGCTQCVCSIEPTCCTTSWDNFCAGLAAGSCNAACQCN